jgi:hypothetical protein
MSSTNKQNDLYEYISEISKLEANLKEKLISHKHIGI